MRVLMTLILAVGAIGCQGSDLTGPTLDELYSLICVDSTIVHPTYRCDSINDVTLIITIPNPNPPD